MNKLFLGLLCLGLASFCYGAKKTEIVCVEGKIVPELTEKMNEAIKKIEAEAASDETLSFSAPAIAVANYYQDMCVTVTRETTKE